MGIGVGQEIPWLGLSAPQLSETRWISPAQILEIGREGNYNLPNSLSSNSNGIVCARISLSNGKRLWVEWRQAINQDKFLSSRNVERYRKEFLGSQSRYNAPYLGSLLVREVLPGREKEESLLAIIPPGRSADVFGVRIQHGQGFSFSVTGIR